MAAQYYSILHNTEKNDVHGKDFGILDQFQYFVCYYKALFWLKKQRLFQH